jgi:hypothetical protein
MEDSGCCRFAANLGNGGGQYPGLLSIMGTNLECDMSNSARLAAILASSPLFNPPVRQHPQSGREDSQQATLKKLQAATSSVA